MNEPNDSPSSHRPRPLHQTSAGQPDHTAELTPGDDADLAAPLPVEVPGSMIGPYRLIRQIGEGGFGAVFLAEQEVPVQRSVAIKVVKLGMDTRRVVARFEQERQTLAFMEHPNIARVLDAGATSSGRPYFVMELVKGEPIVAYCDRHQLSVRQRIELVVDVCMAVQHAHTKGVLHRDLKPSNILVADQDGRPTAKVIDFGIAKATGASASGSAAITEAQQLIGTPEYMSPEQAEGSFDIDTRTDIYSLGVVLYELLTGSTPFRTSELRSLSHSDMQRMIRDIDPPPPSSRFARHASAEWAELDWIVMKALEKDRARRYESASDLAADIKRYLAGDAVFAAPPSRVYRVKKFARRHRVGVGITALFVVTLVVGATLIAWQSHQTRLERDRAILAESEQRERAVELAAVAEFQASMLSGIDVASAGTRLLSGMRTQFTRSLQDDPLSESERLAREAAFERDLATINATDEAKSLIQSTVLTPAIAAIDAQFASQPLVDAALRHTLARVHVALGILNDALPLAQRAHEIRVAALGENHRDTLNSFESVAMILEGLGRASEATATYLNVYRLREASLGPLDPDTLTAMSNLGNIYRSKGNLEAAEPLLTQALAGQREVLGDEARGTLIAANTLGYLYVSRGNHAKAQPLWREAYETGTRVFGEDDSDVIVWRFNLAGLLQNLGQLSEAEPHFRAVFEKYEKLLGSLHPSTITVLGGVCRNLIQQSRFSEAEPFVRDMLERSSQALGADHPSTLAAMTTLGSLLNRMERYEEAETTLRHVLAERERTIGSERAETLIARELLAQTLVGRGSFEEAATLFRSTIELSRRVLGPENPQTLSLLTNAGSAFRSMQRPGDAEPLLIEALATRSRVSGKSHVETLVTMSSLASLRYQLGALDEAVAGQTEALAGLRAVLSPNHVHCLYASMHLAQALRATGKSADAESLIRDTVPRLESTLGATSSAVARARFIRGEALTDLGRFEEAADQLSPAVETILARPASTPTMRLECARAMARLYERWNAAAPDPAREASAAHWAEQVKAMTQSSTP